MKIIVENTSGGWVRFAGLPRTVEKMVSVCTITFADGRTETEHPCEPYPVKIQVDPGCVLQLVEQGIWSDSDLVELGLRLAVPFEPPVGKRIVGSEAFSESSGVVFQVFATEDQPSPPAEPTREERLARLLSDYGLTLEDLASAKDRP